MIVREFEDKGGPKMPNSLKIAVADNHAIQKRIRNFHQKLAKLVSALQCVETKTKL